MYWLCINIFFPFSGVFVDGKNIANAPDKFETKQVRIKLNSEEANKARILLWDIKKIRPAGRFIEMD